MSETDLRARLRWLGEGIRARVDDGAADAGSALGAFLDDGAGDERPFYAFVNLVEAHSPYLPPRPYNPLGPLDRARAAIEARRHLTMGEIWRACAGGFDVPAPALERMRRLYAAAVRLLDDWLGRVLEDLERRGILEETIVIVTSDHGENFGEGGLMGHAYSLDKRLIRLPFAAAGPFERPDGAVHARLAAGAALRGRRRRGHPYAASAGRAEASSSPSSIRPPAPGDPRVGKALELWNLPRGVGRADHRAAAQRLRRRRPLQAGRPRRQRAALRPRRRPARARSRSTRRRAGDAAAAADLERLRAALAAAEGPAAGEGPPAPQAADGVPPPSGEISDEERAKLEERMKLLGYL